MFLTVMTVAEALVALAPARRSAVVAGAPVLGAVPARDVLAAEMGGAPEGAVRPGSAMAIPTGGLLPDGADAVVMIEHTTEPMPGHVELLRPVAPGEGVLHAGEEARPGDELVP